MKITKAKNNRIISTLLGIGTVFPGFNRNTQEEKRQKWQEGTGYWRVLRCMIAAVLFMLPLFIMLLPATADAMTLYLNGQEVQYDGSILRLTIDGEIIETDVPPVIFDNRTLVPAAAVFERLGATVKWNGETREVTISMDNKVIVLKIDEKQAKVNGFPAVMDVPPMIINDRTFIPLRFVAEHLGLIVGWHPDNDEVSINSDAKILDISFVSREEESRLTVRGDKELGNYKVTEDVENSKLIIELEKAKLALIRKLEDVDDSFVSKVTAIQHSENPYVVRIELDMKKWTAYKTSKTSDGYSLEITFTSRVGIYSGFEFKGNNEEAVFTFRVGYEPRANIFRLTAPDRIVIDFSNTLNESDSNNTPIDSPFVSAVRCSQFTTDTTRVVLDLKGQFHYDVERNGSALTVRVKNATYKNITYANNGDTAWLEIDGIDLTGLYNKRMDTMNRYFVIAFDADRIDVGTGTMNINDDFISTIDIQTDEKANLTRIFLYEKAYYYIDVIGDKAGNKTRIQIFKPESMTRERLVVIDAGHGDTDPGAVWEEDSGKQLLEKDFNLDIALRLNALLEKNGVKTYMTREDDTFVGLYDRPYIANAINADLFVSIHNNAVWNQEVRGTMTLFNPNDTRKGFNSKRFAEIVQAKLIQYLKTVDRGIVERPDLVVLNQSKMPAILAEVAFLTNEGDRNLLQQEEFRQKAAEALCDAILQAIDEMGRQ